MKWSIGFAALGLAALAWLLSRAGLDDVRQALASAHWYGFALFSAWQLLLTGPLAAALASVLPEAGLALAAWSRLVREAVGNCLPFTAIGGLVVGARVLARRPRIGWASAGAATTADATLEFVSQIVFVLIALAIIAAQQPRSALVTPVAWTVLAAALVGVGALAAQGRGADGLRWLEQRLGSSQMGTARSAGLAEALDQLHARPGRLARGAALHLLAWIGSGGGTLIAYRLLGGELSLSAALVIEALLSFSRALAFFVPGGIGVQEAAYVTLGQMYGVDDHISLGVSLLRRARDFVIGAPVLVAWYAGELRGLRRGAKTA